MKRCKHTEVYVLHDLTITDCEKDEENFDDCKHDPHMHFINEDVHLNSVDRRRESTRIFNIIDVGINFIISYCGSFPSTRSSIGEHISLHAHILRAVFCDEKVFKLIVK